MSENIGGHVRPLVVAVGCMLIVAASTASVAWLMRSMVNSIFVDANRSAIWSVGLAIIAAFFAKGIAGYFQATIMGSVGASIVANIQKKQFEKLMTLDVAFYSGSHPAKFIGKMLHSAQAARSIIVLVLTNLFRDVFTLVGLAAVMFFQDPTMSLLALCGAPFIVLGISRIVRKTREVAKREADIVSNVTASATEAIQGVRVVKSFNLEDEMNRRVAASIDQMEARANTINKITSLTSPMMDIVGGLIIGFFVFYAGWQTVVYGKTPGEFMAFITAFLLAYEPAKRLAGFQVQLHRQLVGVERMYELLDATDIEAPLGPVTKDFRASSGNLEFRNVSFGYESDTPVLRDVSFDALPGQKIALVGRSGAGKSTIFNLMLGIYRGYQGSITIDGVPIDSVDLPDLRASIAYVAQDTFLFSGTVGENIRFGRRLASDREVVEAANAADALNFIEALPEGFDTMIGDNGSRLSGGQRQRIAIARALIKDAPILLLDEATSALDGETERAVKNAESRLIQGRTTIIIAHRLSTIKQADRIVVLDHGRVMAEGTHDELSRSNPIYQSLFHDGEFVTGPGIREATGGERSG